MDCTKCNGNGEYWREEKLDHGSAGVTRPCEVCKGTGNQPQGMIKKMYIGELHEGEGIHEALERLAEDGGFQVLEVPDNARQLPAISVEGDGETKHYERTITFTIKPGEENILNKLFK